MRKIGKLKLKRRKQKVKVILEKVYSASVVVATIAIVITLCKSADKINQVQYGVKPSNNNVAMDITTSAGATHAINTSIVDVTVTNMDKELVEQSQPVEEQSKFKTEPYKIRTTGYCDHGYMKGGKWVYDGAIAGKEEWLGRHCNLYRVNKDGSIGELIGTYTFEDTGYGIKTETPNGIEGSLKLGLSVDIWFPTEDDIWDFIGEYGDYTYIEWLD